MTGVVHALPLGPRLIPIRVLGTNADAPGVATFVKAGATLQSAHSNADLRNATDLVARSAQEMGLDRFRPFLRQADDHLAQTGGMAALLREAAPAPAPLSTPRTPTPPGTGATPPLPPPGALMPLIGRLLRGAGWLVLAGTPLDGLIRANQEAQVRAAIERFKLDPSKPADMAAALAYAWARTNRSLLLGTSLPESAQDAVAEQVMRAVRADPALLDRAMASDASALATIRAAVKATPTPGTVYEGRNDDKRALIAQLFSDGKSGTETRATIEDV
jgi:hypothetical protein